MKNTKSTGCFKLLQAITLSILLASVSLSQIIENQDNENKSEHKYLQIGFINETALYYHYPFSASTSLKSGISINWDYDDEKDGEGYIHYQRSYYPYNEDTKMKSNKLNNRYEITASSIILFQLNDYEYAKLHLGVGPSVSYSYSKALNSYSSYTDTTLDNYSNESINKVFGIGPSLTFMITSHIYRSIFVVSEYNFAAFYNWNTDESGFNNYYKSPNSTNSPSYYSDQNHVESNGWKLKFTSVKVGLLIEL